MDDSAGYRVAIDTGDDGSFATDLSAAVIALSWRLGMAAPGDRLAMPARARVSLRNETRRHSPEVSLLTLLPGLGLRICYVHDAGKTTTLFQGQLARTEPQTGSQGARRAILYAEDWQQQLRENDTQLPTQESARADEIIADILDGLPIRRRELAGRAILGLAGHDALGGNDAPLQRRDGAADIGARPLAFRPGYGALACGHQRLGGDSPHRRERARPFLL